MLVACPECKAQVSDTALACPHCGFSLKPIVPPIVPQRSATPFFLIAAGITTFLCLYVPRILIVVPVLAAIILSIISLVRRERARPLAFVFIGLAVLFYILTAIEMERITSRISGNSDSSDNSHDKLSFYVSQCEHEADSYYMTVQGTVTNYSPTALNDVQAVVSYSSESGTFVSSDSSYIDYNPIMAGQTSPFKVLTRWNPEMKNCAVTFKNFDGTIPSTGS